MGWSMGGYGALLAAERHPRRFRAVAVSSAALWTSYAEQHAAVPDAFDGPADYARNDVFVGAGRLARTAVSISCGTADPFVAADRAFVAQLPRRPGGEFVKGCHDEDFWRRMLPAQVRSAANRHIMKRYKVVTSQDTVFWGGSLNPDAFEERLNAAAADGWELVTTTTVESTGFLGERHQLFFVFAQEA
jgi:pimeloyl-ACP methyl ester carboxylesterase